MAKHIPNILTIIRFFLIPIIVHCLFLNYYMTAFIFLTLSGLTDILDGFIARKFNFITTFGKLVDPLADKATQISILFVLVVQHILPIWILVVVLIKEFALIVGASFLYGKEFVVSSKWYGKLSTTLFYIAIVSSLFIGQFNSMVLNHPEYSMNALPSFDLILFYLAIISTLFSLVMYCYTFYRQYKKFQKSEKTTK